MFLKKIFTSPVALYIVVFIICALLSAINLHLKLEATPNWYSGALEYNHKALLDFNYTNNEQSRLFQFYIPELLVRLLNLSIPDAYALQRFSFTAISFYLFFLFAKKWFNNALSFLCVLIMASIMPFTYYGHLQESAPLMSLTFLCAIWAIREKKHYWYSFTLFIGSINNETMLFVPMIYFLYDFNSFQLREAFMLGLRTIYLALPALIVVGIIRYYNIDRPNLSGPFTTRFYENTKMFMEVVKIFNILWLLAYLGFKNKPLFLQRCLLSIPFFILPHMLVGVISETRQMIPLSFIIIPSALFYLKNIMSFLFQGSKTVVGYSS